MRNLFLKTLAISLFLLGFPTIQHGQNPQFTPQQATIDFDITEINVFDERVYFMYNLLNDGRFDVVNSENDGVFIVSVDPAYQGMDLKAEFESFREQNAQAFSSMGKDEATEKAFEYKALLPQEITLSLMMELYVKSRQNNLCANADPFCTDNGLYEFPAGVNAGSGESGPNYNCLSSTPNPAWYYMRIGNPGNINIYMYSTPSRDIDFCCWGPFDDPIAPCPNGLTSAKVVSCSYSANATETCAIPSNAQSGKYYILVITNYSNNACNITFSKTSGTGTTDCGIMPPLVNNDGPYCVTDAIHLTGNGQSGASYYWTGPNGFTSTQQNPVINNCNLSHAGTYTCTISLNSATNSSTTEVEVFAKPTANFTASSVCLGEATQFNNTSTTNPSNQLMSCLWDFGDGQTSTQLNPSHQFARAGTQNVTLTVNCGNCTSTKTQSVTVYETPTANAGEDQTIQYGNTAQLHGSGGTGTYNYHWEPANKVTNPNAQNTQTVGLTESTTFTLTVTHPQGGCTSTDQVSILVNGSNMTATASASPNSICLGETSQLNARAVGGNSNNYSFSWTPSLGLNNPLSATPIATPTATTTYTCTVTDGYTTQQVSTTVTVNQPEHSEVTQYICPGDSYSFYGNNYSEPGSYTYTTTTAQGCEKTITLQLRHYPSYPNAHTTTEAICYGTSYNFHGQYFNTEGLHSVNLHTVHGCDSIVWLDLTVYPENPVIVDNRSICSSQSLTWYDGNVYNQDGDEAFYDSIDNHGCLQVYQLHLSVGDYQTPPNYDPRKYVCVPYDEQPFYHWDIANRDYTQNAQDTIIVSNPDPNGCDFEYTLDLKFHQNFHEEQTVVACDEFIWDIDHNPYSQSGTYEYPNNYVTGGFDCPGEYVLHLTINDSNEQHDHATACNEYTWEYGLNHETTTYDAPGFYEQNTETAEGCVLHSTLDLQLDYTPSFPKVMGKPWVVGGSEFQYTIEQYWLNLDHPRSTHETTWELFDSQGNPFRKWDILPYDDGDKCYLYIFTFETDSVRLHVHTFSTSECGCGEDEKDLWIHCGYHNVNETIDSSSVDIFPNPTSGNMTLSFDNMMGETLIKVFNITGTLIDQFTLHNDIGHQTFEYKADKLSPGIYFFNIINKKGILTKKVIIID